MKSSIHVNGAGGFTLLELMVALTVLSILIAVAVPSFREIGLNSRAAAAHSDLVTALSYARSEAVRRGRNVAVCATTNFTNCTGPNGWPTGWIVFTDDSGVAGNRDGTDELLQRWNGPGPNVTDWGYFGTVVLTPSFARFTPTGTTVPTTPKAWTIQRHNCPSGMPNGRRILTVSAVGHIQTTRVDCP
ncbi:MAG: GspH/FimT family pseudopilin [Steroidobacteraceae bacterium]|nr:GspH/FimT family pseudopilin [Steroidobacteraceae bacterium]MDW8258648.1 GspH/FimT family pseudopilin [Gammaproteobacteria bacterium]